MLDNVRYNANTNISNDDTRIKSSNFANRPSFKANPNAVDNTPSQDSYAPQGGAPAEAGMAGKLKYILPTWFVLHNGTNLFNKANGGAYEKSLVGRLGRFGDWLSGTPLINNKLVEKFTSHCRTIKNNLKTFVSKHEPLRVMAETPTRPESPMVTNFLETQAEADLKEALDKFGKYIDKGPKSLKQAGATKAEIQALKARYGTGLFGNIKNEAAAIQEFMLGKLGADLGHADILGTIGKREAALGRQIEKWTAKLADTTLTPEARQTIMERIAKISDLGSTYRADTLRRLKLQASGLSHAALEAAKKAPVANITKIETALGASKKYCPKLAEHFNKIKSINGPATKLGKLFPKMAKLGMRGLTFGGGLFNTLLVAFFMGEAVKNTIDAPKEKKTSTAVHGLMDAMSWVIAMPIALKAMHAVNGLKNLGKSKVQVDAFKTALKTFNEQAKSGAFKSHASYNRALKNLMSLKNAGTAPKGLGKLFSKVASFLSIGLEQIEPFKRNTSNFTGALKKAAKYANFKGKLPNILRNCVGYPLRFALYMFAFQPVVDKVFSGALSAIFGKPFDPEKEKEEAEKKALRDVASNPIQPGWFSAISRETSPYAKEGLKNLDMNTISEDNLVKQELRKNGVDFSKQTQATQQNGYTNSVNGISVTTKNDAEPFMPPNYQQNGQTTGPNGVINNNNDQKDPNVSEYDTVPLTYQPSINHEQPVPYGDPDLNNNINRMNDIINRNNQIISDIDKEDKKKK